MREIYELTEPLASRKQDIQNVCSAVPFRIMLPIKGADSDA